MTICTQAWLVDPWDEGCEALCCCSVAQSCLTLCDPMDCGTPGFPVLHHLPEFAQIRVHWCSTLTLHKWEVLIVMPALCAFPEVNWWYYCMILYFQMWKSRYSDVMGCGSHWLVPGPREGVSPHWEDPCACPWPGASSPETNPVPCLSQAVLQAREFLLLGGVMYAYPGRVSGNGHFHIHLEALAPTSLLPTHPLSLPSMPTPTVNDSPCYWAKVAPSSATSDQGKDLWPLSGSLPQRRSHHQLHLLTVPKVFSLLLPHQCGLFCEVL